MLDRSWGLNTSFRGKYEPLVENAVRDHQAANHPKVAGLVSFAAFAPARGESV
jgi:hypothetical protein